MRYLHGFVPWPLIFLLGTLAPLWYYNETVFLFAFLFQLFPFWQLQISLEGSFWDKWSKCFIFFNFLNRDYRRLRWDGLQRPEGPIQHMNGCWSLIIAHFYIALFIAASAFRLAKTGKRCTHYLGAGLRVSLGLLYFLLRWIIIGPLLFTDVDFHLYLKMEGGARTSSVNHVACPSL